VHVLAQEYRRGSLLVPNQVTERRKEMQKVLEKLMSFDPALLTVYQGDIFTVVRAAVTVNGAIFYAEGLARKSHLDSFDAKMGETIAAGRALKALAKKVICRKKTIHHRFMG
jgi:hypothetical protein